MTLWLLGVVAEVMRLQLRVGAPVLEVGHPVVLEL